MTSFSSRIFSGVSTALFATSLLASSATLSFADEAERAAAEDGASDRICFWTRNIDDFRAIDNKHVYLDGVGKNEKFLATLFNHCHGIRFAEVIKLSSRPTSRVCDNGNEHIEIYESGFSFPQRCLIADIERVESLDQARAWVEERKKQADDQEEDVSSLDMTTVE